MNNQEKAKIFEDFVKGYDFYRLKLFEDSYIYRNLSAREPLIHDNCIFDVMGNDYTLMLQFHKYFSVEVSYEKNGKYFNVAHNKNLIKFSVILYKASGKHVGYNELVELFGRLR